jgi:hypothetical protein
MAVNTGLRHGWDQRFGWISVGGWSAISPSQLKSHGVPEMRFCEISWPTLVTMATDPWRSPGYDLHPGCHVCCYVTMVTTKQPCTTTTNQLSLQLLLIHITGLAVIVEHPDLGAWFSYIWCSALRASHTLWPSETHTKQSAWIKQLTSWLWLGVNYKFHNINDVGTGSKIIDTN